MAITTKRLCKGTLGTTSATLYTAPSATGNYTVVKAVTLCNGSDAAAAVTLTLAGTTLVSAHVLAARDTITIPFMDQVLQAGETIDGLAGTDAVISYYISGKEVV